MSRRLLGEEGLQLGQVEVADVALVAGEQEVGEGRIAEGGSGNQREGGGVERLDKGAVAVVGSAHGEQEGGQGRSFPFRDPVGVVQLDGHRARAGGMR